MFYNKTKAEPVQDMATESYWDVTKNRYLFTRLQTRFNIRKDSNQ